MVNPKAERFSKNKNLRAEKRIRMQRRKITPESDEVFNRIETIDILNQNQGNHLKQSKERSILE